MRYRVCHVKQPSNFSNKLVESGIPFPSCIIKVYVCMYDIRAGGSNFILPRPVADEGYDFWGDFIKNYVEFTYSMYIISISKSIN